jgi:hypothetical protein
MSKGVKEPHEITRLWEKKKMEDEKKEEIEKKMPKTTRTMKTICGRIFFYSHEINKWYPVFSLQIEVGRVETCIAVRGIRYVSDKMSEHLDKHVNMFILKY